VVAQAEKPPGLKRIADELGIPKSTAHGILRDLLQEAFIEPGEAGTYVLGVRALGAGAAHLRAQGINSEVQSELTRLARNLDGTAHFAVLDGTDVVYLCKQDPPGLRVQLVGIVGSRLPAQLTAAGKCCLAWLPPPRLTLLLERTKAPACAPSHTDLLRDLDLVRRRGFATDLGQTSTSVHSVAAPLRRTTDDRGAIGVSFLRGGETPVHVVIEQVRRTADRISNILERTP
jgi:DNA-binding IclR family transcriptional regulator